MFDQLQSVFSGELYVDDKGLDAAIRTVYATDASEYQEKPLAVAIPKTIADIKALFAFATEQKISLIPRAAGTSLAGQVVGSGMVVDISKYFTAILELNEKEKWVRVQPGVIRDDLNAFLKPFGLMFGPETSTANRAMIGGMIGNNSCGLHSIIWGTTRDNLLETNVILSDGTETVFKGLTKAELENKCMGSGAESDIYKSLKALVENKENQQAIEEGFPRKDIKRRNTGYALDAVLDMSRFEGDEQYNLSKLIAGSEGTLCFVTEAKLQLLDIPPSQVAMVAVHTKTLQDALQANLVALEHGCAASELVDDFILQFTKSSPELSQSRAFIEGEPKAILMVEFFHNDQNELMLQCQSLIKALQEKNIGYAYPVLQDEQCKLAWDVRKAGLGLLRNLPGDARPVNLIEDCAVSPQDLPNYITDLEQLLQRHGLQYSMYAHAGAGELHVEPIINLKTEKGIQQFRKVLTETAALVKSYHGSLSGEHGDGRLRGEFIPMMMGEHNYGLFRQVKRIFDPNNIFNRGKIVDTPPMDEQLRFNPSTTVKPAQTVYNFQPVGGYLKLTEKCSGSGDCRKTEVSGGTMCPSYMATRSERDTTRARANVLRQYLTNESTNLVDKEAVKEIMDLCLSCKACKSECPSSVDVAKLKGEFMQSYYDEKGVPFRTKLIGNFSGQMKMASMFSGIYNWMIKTPTLRKTMNRLVGFHPERSLPLVTSKTLREWHRSHVASRSAIPKTADQHFNNRVYLFCDEFTNYNDVEIGKQCILLMERLGYEVCMVEHPDSARTYLSKGLIREAKKIANQQVQIFSSIISESTPLIGIEPSAILGFRDEYLDLVDPALLEKSKQLANHVYLFEEWFMREADKGKITPSSFTNTSKKIKIHGHCHQKSQASMVPVKRALSFPANYEARLIPSGCCGMAGSFGYEQEHYDISMKVGELVLFKAVREANEEVLISASGTSCRHQIKDGTGKRALHSIELLYAALRE
jgi:FAD/FMN-containing dehydrogenase/Fe-S oxidoreductase